MNIIQKIVAIDSQKLDAISSCAYFYNLRYNRNKVLLNTPEYLERGSLIHHMMAAYYKLRKYRSRWAQNNQTYADIIQYCINIGRHSGTKMQLDIAEIEYTIEIFQQYTDHWENDSWDDVIGVEEVGSKVLYESPELIILYEVKMDLILRLAGRLIAVDHKHSQSRRDPNQLANQFKGYCFFLENNNIIVNEIGFQKTVKPVDKFRRHTLSFSDAIIEEWKFDAIYWVKNLLALESIGYYPHNYTSCDKFSGCDFKHVCMKDPGEYREYTLGKDFVERIWDVGKEHL